jgi:hypothetical protein
MAKKTKIKLRSEVMPELTDWEKRMDSVKYIQDGKRECDILRRAWRCYDSLEQFREDSRRNYRYVMGDQWGDEIRVNGCRCKERDNMIARGNVPLTNNMLNRLVTHPCRRLAQARQDTCVCRQRPRRATSIGYAYACLAGGVQEQRRQRD